MFLVRAKPSCDQLAHGIFPRRLGIVVARNPGIDRVDLDRAEADGQRGFVGGVGHIHKLVSRHGRVKRIRLPSARILPVSLRV